MAQTVYSMEPIGRTGGRVYLRMLHEVTADLVEWQTLTDHKRQDPVRRWRKIRHLQRLAPLMPPLDRPDISFVWDDLSLILFSREMRQRTIFILHHYEPLQHDSAPLEAALWQYLFSLLPECAAVVCVAPYWAEFLRERGVRDVRVIYNAFDMAEIDKARAVDRARCRAEFSFEPGTIAVYTGKAVHWKGTECVAKELAGAHGIQVVASGNNTIGFTGTHLDLPRDRYLRLLRACDVGVFRPRMHEGWSRCAAEALLLGLPSLVQPLAGLRDLAALTQQPPPDTNRLAEQVRRRAQAPGEEARAAYETLAQFNQAYFAEEWSKVLAKIT
ncbi:glycosyltransferase [Streptomyces sp. PCS3-D2]|uniref:glycosyltransferase n=1 Tax=Streptomyces sp. PCS3-D2 TaxID=1460244 RepID=UPI00044A830F|nr:glycosyltransferase [Streptomyces sp. PCS3-D2]WKV74177.1 glycosyltransferase [Streptomyces sp. PCS3-D2]